MNWVDYLLTFVLLGTVISSCARGFSREVIGLVSTVAGFFCAMWFYGSAGAFLLPYVSSKGVANFCGFLIVFFGILLLGTLIGNLLAKVLKWTGLSVVDRMLGGLFGLVKGLLIAVAFLLIFSAFVPGSEAGAPPRAIVESKVAPYVLGIAHAASRVAPYELKSGFQKTYEQIQEIWRNTIRKTGEELPRKDL